MNAHRRPGLCKRKLQELRHQRRMLLLELHELQMEIHRLYKKTTSANLAPKEETDGASACFQDAA